MWYEHWALLGWEAWFRGVRVAAAVMGLVPDLWEEQLDASLEHIWGRRERLDPRLRTFLWASPKFRGRAVFLNRVAGKTQQCLSSSLQPSAAGGHCRAKGLNERHRRLPMENRLTGQSRRCVLPHAAEGRAEQGCRVQRGDAWPGDHSLASNAAVECTQDRAEETVLNRTWAAAATSTVISRGGPGQ